MLRKRVAQARPRTVLAIAWLWLLVYGFPGQMVPDTFEHLLEARAGIYTDGSPPAFTLLFAISDALSGGQLLLFLAQITAFVAGTYLTLRRFVPRTAHWWTLVLCAFPPIFTTLPIVWKDALMPALLLLGIGCILDERRWVRLAGLAALFGAIAIRYNAFAAAFPIVVLLFEWRTGLHWAKRYAIATAAWLAITFGAFVANDLLTDRPMYVWSSSLALYDIAGTLKNVEGTIPDAELAPVFAGTGLRVERDIHAHIRDRYRIGNFFNLIVPPDPLWDVPIRGNVPPPEAQREAITRAFKTIVGNNLGAYARHRWLVWRECLALRRNTHAYWAVPVRVFPYPETAKAVGVSTYSSRLQVVTTQVLDDVWHNSALFEPSLYFLLTFLLLPFTRKHRAAFAILLSGIAVELTLLFLASSPDFRYSHWMVLCTCVALIALVSQRMVAARRDDPALGRVAGEDPVDARPPRDVA